jgi:hypothetical protein
MAILKGEMRNIFTDLEVRNLPAVGVPSGPRSRGLSLLLAIHIVSFSSHDARRYIETME